MLTHTQAATEFALEVFSPNVPLAEQVAARLFHELESEHNERIQVLGLDTRRTGLEPAIKWVREFHDAWLRSAGAGQSEWLSSAVPPTVVVLAAAPHGDQTPGDLDSRLAAEGAVIYEVPGSIASDENALLAWLHRELGSAALSLTETDKLEAVERDARVPGAPGTGLTPYIDPVVRLRDEDFENTLDRGRQTDPLATSD